ncbi:Uma2 family endonuclease, partial [Myxococcota bacterium]|nr:Uma2 family endonuclease [Myxococcota bacterium]
MLARRFDPPPVVEDVDQRIVLHGVTWTEYEIMLAVRADRPTPRMTYLAGELELMSPSRSHEEIKKLIARLLETYALESGLVLEGYGSMTMRSAPDERGAEPDECYALGGKKDRPDLAIEVVWTSRGLDKREVYRKLDIPELWIWEAGTITVHQL